MIGKLMFINGVWEKAEKHAGSILHPPSSDSSGGFRIGTDPSGSDAGQSSSGSEAHPWTSNVTASQDNKTDSESSGDLSGRDECDELLDTPWKDMNSPLPSSSTPHQDSAIYPTAAGCSSANTRPKPSETDDIVRLPKDSHDWILGVEAARQLDQLVDVIDHSAGMQKYATEEARDLPTENWHSWTSVYAFWYTPIPSEKNRGVLSCNDWVQFKGHPPLTRPLGHDE